MAVEAARHHWASGAPVSLVAHSDTLPRCLALVSCPPLQKNHLSGLQRRMLKLYFWNQEQLQQARSQTGRRCWAPHPPSRPGSIVPRRSVANLCLAQAPLALRNSWCLSPPHSLQVRRELAPIVARNRRRADGASAYAAVAAQQRPAAAKAGKERLQVSSHTAGHVLPLPEGLQSMLRSSFLGHSLPPCLSTGRVRTAHALQDAQDAIVEMREHDVPYHVRFAIDTDTRCGHWFTVRAKVGGRGWCLSAARLRVGCACRVAQG